MGKTSPKEKEVDGSPRKKTPRVDDPALITTSAPSPAGKTPPKGEEVEESPRKKAVWLGDVALATVPMALASSPMGKTPPKGEEAEESPRKKAPRVGDVALATGPGASEPNPTGEACNTPGVYHQLSGGFKIKHDRLGEMTMSKSNLWG
jgi:hypothetical protein